MAGEGIKAQRRKTAVTVFIACSNGGKMANDEIALFKIIRLAMRMISRPATRKAAAKAVRTAVLSARLRRHWLNETPKMVCKANKVTKWYTMLPGDSVSS